MDQLVELVKTRFRALGYDPVAEWEPSRDPAVCDFQAMRTVLPFAAGKGPEIDEFIFGVLYNEMRYSLWIYKTVVYEKKVAVSYSARLHAVIVQWHAVSHRS